MTRRLTPADRRVLRWLPMAVLLPRDPGQPGRFLRALPQLEQMQQRGLLDLEFDAAACAATLILTAAGRQALHGGADQP